MTGRRAAGRVVLLTVAGLSLAGGLQPVAARPGAGSAHRAPLVIPALRQWYPGRGSWQLSPRSRILVAPQQPHVLAIARQLSSDLRTDVGRRLPVVEQSSNGRNGDVVLRQTQDLAASLGTEGYALAVDTTVRITAASTTGIFYGGRSLLQLLHQARSIPRGFGLDRPRYPQRGLMVDASRTTYSTKWVLREIRRLAAIKLNVLHLHLTDDQRWAITSKSYPTVVGKHPFTRGDIRRILRLAHRDHVLVIPEIEMPGHMASFLSRHPGMELKLADAAGSSTSQQYVTDKLDITNPKALAAMRRILDEYLPLFPGRYWDMGDDEYVTPAEYPEFPQLASTPSRAMARVRPRPTPFTRTTTPMTWDRSPARRSCQASTRAGASTSSTVRS